MSCQLSSGDRDTAYSMNSPQSPFEVAKSNLHVKHCPETLPCRDHEFDYIYTSLESSINSKSGSCIYISGMPGTGKTATVNCVIKEMQNDDQINSFDYHVINCNKLLTPQHAISALCKHLTGKIASDPTAKIQEMLDKLPRPVVVLIDELDSLIGSLTNKRSVGQKVVCMWSSFNTQTTSLSGLVERIHG